jgi:hypothetical protein
LLYSLLAEADRGREPTFTTGGGDRGRWRASTADFFFGFSAPA